MHYSYKMKLALYLAGHLRTFDSYIKNSIKTFMEGYDYDLYVSTHYNLDREEITEYNKKLKKEEIIALFDGLPLKNIKITKDKDAWYVPCVKCKKNEAKYGPKNYVSYKTGLADKNREPCTSHCFECKSEDFEIRNGFVYLAMWNHVYNCYQMAKETEEKSNFKYDYHIRSRPDIVYLEKINFNLLPKLNDKLYAGFGTTLGSPDDMFSIGCGEAWKDYCDIDKVILNSLGGHEVTDYTFQKYPVYKIFQIAIIRYRDTSAKHLPVTVKKIHDNKYIIWYDKNIYI